MTPDEIKEAKEKHKKREKNYYAFTSEIQNIRWKLQDVGGKRRQTTAYKQLHLSLDAYEQQIRADFSRYEKQVSRYEGRDVIKQLQQSLNRERTLREGLESKIKEASESSGLFISYVRKKLKF